METETHTATLPTPARQLPELRREDHPEDHRGAQWALRVHRNSSCSTVLHLTDTELQHIVQLALDVADMTPQLWTAAPASTELEATR